MRANKEDIDSRGDDYAANENDYYDPTPVKQEPVRVGPKVVAMILVLAEAARSLRIATGGRINFQICHLKISKFENGIQSVVHR